MKVYTFSEAGQRLATLLDQAARDGAVRIVRRDGQTFRLAPEVPKHSPLNVQGVPLKISSREIVEVVREGRQRG